MRTADELGWHTSALADSYACVAVQLAELAACGLGEPMLANDGVVTEWSRDRALREWLAKWRLAMAPVRTYPVRAPYAEFSRRRS